MFRRSGLSLARLDRFWKDQNGATAIEYGMIAGLMFLAIVTACSAFGDSAITMFQRISNEIDKVM
jgi:pilus assembly protein Flp/PilA